MIVDPAQLNTGTMARIKIGENTLGWAFPFTTRPAEGVDREGGGRYLVKASVK